MIETILLLMHNTLAIGEFFLNFIYMYDNIVISSFSIDRRHLKIIIDLYEISNIRCVDHSTPFPH